LAERLDLLHERLDLIRAVEEAELCVQMEMNERRSHGRILGGRGRGSQTRGRGAQRHNLTVQIYLGLFKRVAHTKTGEPMGDDAEKTA
jgi:hypothetical protein